MQDSYKDDEEEIIVSVWDVRNGILHSNNSKTNINIPYDLEAEAANWLKIWDELDEDETED